MSDPRFGHQRLLMQRRAFLAQTGVGLGAAALSMLLDKDAAALDAAATAGSYRGLPHLPHHQPRVKRVIFLCMAGGPSHLESFDYKPELARLDGQPMPESFTRGQPIAQLQNQELKVQGHLTGFKQYGASGQWISRSERATVITVQVEGRRRWSTRSMMACAGHVLNGLS